MGFKIGNKNKRFGAESADSDLAAFRDGMISLDDTASFDTQAINGEADYYDDYPEEDSEEYYDRDEYSEYGDDSDYASDEDYADDEEYAEDEYAEDEYDEEYNTASFDTASLEMLSHVDYDTASIDYDSVRRTVEEQEYLDDEVGYDTQSIGYETAPMDTASLDYTSEIGYDTQSIGYETAPMDTASLDYTSEIGYDTASFDARDIGTITGYETDSIDYREVDRRAREEVTDDGYDNYDLPEDEDGYVDYDRYDKPERRRSRGLEEDELVDLDDSYDDREPKKKKSKKVIFIIAGVAAVIALAFVGVWVFKNKFSAGPSNAVADHTDPAGLGIPYYEEMIGSGSEISGINMIGQMGLISVLDARKAGLSEPPTISDSHDYGETEIITRTTVSIELITVKSDLKIRFINNETGKLIPNIAFKVTVTDPSGKTQNWTDDDLDGIIYKSSISEGKYTVHVEQIEGDSYQGFTWPSDKTITVKNAIEYAAVDVQGEVKDAAQVNENAEDTASRGNTSPQDMSNTVETIDSSTTTLYTEIGKDTIADPNPAPAPSPSPEPKPDVSGGDVSGNETTQTQTQPSETPSVDMNAQLKDKSGNEVYVYENNAYRKATNADYAKFDKFYIVSGVKYTGWQTLDGATYYYDKDGKPVTGTQVINGVTYQFGSDGKMSSASGVLGIDVSKWQGTIDWAAVKAAGVDYVIIRVGYRGSSAGALIDDSMFATNIQGAKAAGLKVGVYFVTQAVNDVEAVYEASMVLDRIRGYSLDYPVFLDVEASGGRGDTIDKATRTAVITAFCETIRSAGYTAGIYANKTWLGSKMDTSAFGNYVIWVAHYSSVCGYTGRYNMWQYTDKGTLPGINGSVDLNLWYS